MRLAALAVALVPLAACQQTAISPAPPPSVSGLRLVPVPSGLRVDGSGGREIGLGRDRLGALQSAARVEGEMPRPVSCASGREGFATKGGITMVFEAGRLVGWEDGTGRAGRGCA